MTTSLVVDRPAWLSASLVAERSGVWDEAEEYANELIKASYADVRAHSEKREWLSPWKERDRRSREVLVPGGTPDPADRLGMYERVINSRQTWLNSRDGVSQFRERPGRRPKPEDPGTTALGRWVPMYLGLERSTDTERDGEAGRPGSDRHLIVPGSYTPFRRRYEHG